MSMGKTARKGRRVVWLAGLFLVLAAGAAAWWWRGAGPPSTAARPPAPIPVTVATAARQDVPIFLDALGIVQASNTIAVRTQIEGPLQSVNFVEGQEVRQGD